MRLRLTAVAPLTMVALLVCGCTSQSGTTNAHKASHAASRSAATSMFGPSEPDRVFARVEEAEKATGLTIRAPTYTDNRALERVSVSSQGSVALGYQNGLVVDMQKVNPDDCLNFEPYLQAAQGWSERAGTDPMEIDVAGNPGVLEARKDRGQWNSDQSSFSSPSLHWWESNQMYTMSVQDSSFFLPDVEHGLQKMLQVARSMY